MANNLPGVGRFVHYVSKKAPYVESSALISGTEHDWRGMFDTAREMAPVTLLGENFVDVLARGYDSNRHASLQVFGLVNVYPEWNIPYSGPQHYEVNLGGGFKQPGTWHWWDECGDINDHIPPEEPA